MAFSGELRGISKSFGACQANRAVNLGVRPGTIHALVGENGAGKSTAMKTLFGLVTPDAGQIVFDSKDVTRHWSPQRAFHLGIGMVHQHFMLAETESVLDNLVLGVELRGALGLRHRRDERAQLEKLMRDTGLEVPLDARVGDLPIGLQSRCEILKVLYRNARFLILDEPTAVLAPQEIDDFLKTLRTLRDTGRTILIVTHKLKEVMAVADDATVMRAGSTVAIRKISETSITELSELMVGRRLQLPRADKLEAGQGAPARARLATIDGPLVLRAGTITGIAGCEGNGQEELIRRITHSSLFAHRDKGQKLELFGRDETASGPDRLRQLPVAVIPADRHKEGLVLGFSLRENLRLGRENRAKRPWDFFGGATEAETALLKSSDVRPPDPSALASALSGGNQQKIVIARELNGLAAESLILAVHPTRGVDVGAIEMIHRRLLDAAARGAAVLLISSELDELMALSHRIGVMYRGKMHAWFEGPRYDDHAIGFSMLSGDAASGKATGT